jgi:predicted MFS family arabinose efflux permease
MAGRLADRLAPGRILPYWLAANVIAYAAAVTALSRDAPVGLLIVCAAALGATTPPAGPVTRGLWPSLVPAERLQTAYAFDAVLNESLFVSGPLIVSALLTFLAPGVIVVIVGLCTFAGVSLLISLPALREREPVEQTEKRHYLGPLGHGQVLVLLGIILCDTFAFGSMLVGVPAATAELGAPTLAGVLLSLGSLGAVISGLIYGARTRSGAPGRQLALFHFLSAVLLVLAGQVSLVVLLALIILGVGLVGGPRDTLHQVVLGDVAPAQYRTEAFAWLGTFMWAGYAGGTAVTGQFVDHANGNVTVAFIAGAVGAGVAACLSLLVRVPTPAETTAEPVPDVVAAEEVRD